MDQGKKSPKICAVSWGRMDVEGIGTGKDFKLHPGGGRPWDWTETGTRHTPGIQPADVAELLDHGATTVVLSQGMLGQLQISPDTLEILESRSITVHIAQTRDAVDLYNLLTETTPVGGLFHSTC